MGERGEQGWEVTGKKQREERRWGKGGKGGRQEGKKEEPRGRSVERGKKGRDENLGIRCRERKGDRKELEERCRKSQAKKNKAVNIYRPARCHTWRCHFVILFNSYPDTLPLVLSSSFSQVTNWGL